LASQLINIKLSDDSMIEHYPNFSHNMIRQNFSQRIMNTANNYLSEMIPNSGRSDPDTGVFNITVLTLEDRRINIYVEQSDTAKILKLKVQRKDGILFYFFMTREK